MKSHRFTVFIALFILLCIQESISLNSFLARSDYQVSYAEHMLLLLYSGLGMPYTTIAFMILADFFLPFPTQSPKRDRIRWAYVQLLACACAAGLMLLLCILIALPLSIPNNASLSGWVSSMHLLPGKIPLISPTLTQAFSPLVSIGLSCLILFCFWLLTAVFLLFFHIMRASCAGVLIWGAMLFSTTILSSDTPSTYLADMRFSLISLLRFSADIHWELWQSLIFYFLCIGAFSVLTVCISRSSILTDRSDRKEAISLGGK